MPSIFVENLLRRIHDGGDPPTSAVSNFPQNAMVHLILPEVGTSARQLIEILKVFEILTFFRGISPRGALDRDALSDLQSFLRAVPAASTRNTRTLMPSDNIASPEGIRAAIFEAWMLSRLGDFTLYPLQDIQKGSYELVFQAANLAAIFGLQDFGVLKDLIQWVTASLSTVINREGFTHQEPLRSGKDAAIRLTPQMVTALSIYKKVDFTEEVKNGERRVRIRLER